MFPNKDISRMLGVEVSRCIALSSLILTGKRYFPGTVTQDLREIFYCLGVLLVGISKEEILLSDWRIVCNAISVLKALLPDLPGFKVFDTTHHVIFHLFQETILKCYGAPHHYSSTKFEKGLQRVKNGIKASNHYEWEETILQRKSNATLLGASLDNDFRFDPEVEPEYSLVVFLEAFKNNHFLKLTLNYCDRVRGNLLLPNQSVQFQSLSVGHNSSRNQVVCYDKHFAYLKYVVASMNGKEIDEKGIDDNLTFLLPIIGFCCKLIVEVSEVAMLRISILLHTEWRILDAHTLICNDA
jgi:hypothetical protein